MANNRIAVLVALEGSDDGLKRALTSAQQSLGELATNAKTAGEKAAAGMAEVKAGMSAFGDQVSSAKSQLLAFLSINWAAGKLQEIVQIADAWNMMAARLKLATIGQQEYAVAQKALFEIAQRIGVPIQETATLYGKLQQAVRMLGGEQKDALTITESISQALRLSGASATEAQSSLLQFGQALASGVLRGEEFNSVVENSPRLAQALADGLNVPIGRLRKLAEEGRCPAHRTQPKNKRVRCRHHPGQTGHQQRHPGHPHIRRNSQRRLGCPGHGSSKGSPGSAHGARADQADPAGYRDPDRSADKQTQGRLQTHARCRHQPL